MKEEWLSIFKRTSDARLAWLFGMYTQKLRWMHSLGTRLFHRYDKKQYWSAELRIEENNLHVNIEPRDRAYFEFFTTGNPISTGTFTQGGIQFPTVRAACIGVEIVLEQGVMTVTPGINFGTRDTVGQNISKVKRPFQAQLIDEPVAEPFAGVKEVLGRQKYTRTLYESYAPMHSHTGVHLTSYNHGKFEMSPVLTTPGADSSIPGTLQGVKGNTSAHGTRDVFYDTPWQDGTGGNAVRDAVLNSDLLLTPPLRKVDWPRASGIQMATHPTYGTREFAIYIDAFSQVSVFPTVAIGAANDVIQNVDQKYVQTKAAGLPAWVYQMSQRFIDWYTTHGDIGITDFPENDWKLSHDGTKACAVVYKRQAVVFDAAFWGMGDAVGNGGTVFNASNFVDYCRNWTSLAERHAARAAPHDTRHISATGLLELTFAITLTGFNAEDFTLDVTCTTVRDPETTPYCTLFAGYVWHDMPDGSAVRGDLCTWDIERYYRFPNILPKKAYIDPSNLQIYPRYPGVYLPPVLVGNEPGVPFIGYIIGLTIFAPQIYRAADLGELEAGQTTLGGDTLYLAQTSLGWNDHERFPGKSWGGVQTGFNSVLGALPTPYDSPYLGPAIFISGGSADIETEGVWNSPIDNRMTYSNVGPLALDIRRTLYSLKNITTGKELRTLPAPPSGVARPTYVQPFTFDAPVPSGATQAPATDGSGNFQTSKAGTYWWSDPHPVTGDGGGVIDFDGYAYSVDSGLPYRAGNTFLYGGVSTPVEPHAQFIKVDMSTLSFVLLFRTGTQKIGQDDINPNNVAFAPFNEHNILPSFWNVSHPACAVYVFNALREVIPPKTLPQEQLTKLTAAATDDFRAKFLSDDGQGPWTFMPLSGGPPNKAGSVDWTDEDMSILRWWIIGREFGGGLSVGMGMARPSFPNPTPPGEIAYWYTMLQTYSTSMGLTLINNPRFHWHMYADCIMNALGNTPWSTFFVHPNGTWAFYDQSCVYNPSGVGGSDGDGTIVSIAPTVLQGGSPIFESTTGFDATKMEHCIFDRVHLQFTLADKQVHYADTSFVDLYNEAVDRGKANNTIAKDETFNQIAPATLQAAFTKMPDGALTDVGLSLQVDWPAGGGTYFMMEEGISNGLGLLDPSRVHNGGGTSGTMDMSLDYWFGGISPQLNRQRITFSSCLLIETV